jgi:prolyl oligopeptidase
MHARIVAHVSALASVLFLFAPVDLYSQSAGAPAIQGPVVAPVKLVVDDYFGTKVEDPYRYMENMNDPSVANWFKAQNDYTRAILDRIPGRAQLLARIRELDKSVPEAFAARLPGEVYIVQKRLPDEDVFKLYVRQGVNGADRLIVDPEKVTLKPEDHAKGKHTIRNFAVSDDGRYINVGIIPGGAETNGELHVFDIATGRETGDMITHGACAEGLFASWLPDNRSFVYGRLQDLPADAPAAAVRQNVRSYIHVLGTNESEDRPVFGAGVVSGIDVDPSLIASVETQPGARYALGLLNGSVTPNSAYYIAPVETIGKPSTPWRKIADFSDGVTDVAIHADDLYLLTYKDASRYKVLREDAQSPDLAAAEPVIPAGEALVTGIRPAQDALYVEEVDGGIGRVLRVAYGKGPKASQIALPSGGKVYVATDARLPGALLFMTSWTKTFKIYAYDPKTEHVSDTGIQPVGQYGDPPDLESVETKIPSHDGTLIPLSIVYRKGLKLDGSNPTLLDGYGGYSVSLDPFFYTEQLAWYEKGGVYAVCHARGGGEYGEEWHLAGKGATKPNTWLDFIACAQYLIDKKYTSIPRLAGTGASAGGILIGRAITERPDLFGAAIIQVGVLDALRFETTANGETNLPEMGSTKTPDGFKALQAMSAYHHIKDQTPYPAVLLTTGSNDPRVDPWESGKMTARLQAATSSGKPILLRVDYGGGHGGGSGENAQEESQADQWTFLLWQFGVPGFQPNH